MKSKVLMALCAMLLCGQASNAEITITLTEVGDDVLVTTSEGSLDLSGLAFSKNVSGSSTRLYTGPSGMLGIYNGAASIYNGSITYTPSAGWTSNSITVAFSTSSGSCVAMMGTVDGSWGGIYVLNGYSSGDTISAFTGTIVDASLDGLGFTADESITATWSTDSMTIQTFPLSSVPEPSTYALIGGLGALGFVSYRRRKNGANA